MAFQGEYFVNRYGAEAAKRTPPIRRMLEMGVPVGAGTDATRVANYNPFNSLYWLVSGKTLGGLEIYPEKSRMSRAEALRLYTEGSSWFSHDFGKKGKIAVGQLADLAVLTEDYFSVPEERIKSLESVLTIVDGKPVYGAAEFTKIAPPALPFMPDWSPVAHFGGYGAPGYARCEADHIHTSCCSPIHSNSHSNSHQHQSSNPTGWPQLWGSGCDCFAF
jgi:hypothetical protein